MVWSVAAADEFALEFPDFQAEVQDEIAALVRLLETFGPDLKRPHCDTLKGSRFSRMKELRFEAAGGVWRAAGDKSGGGETGFYKRLI